MDYLLHIIILIQIYVLLAMSINTMLGYTGLLSMMQAVFYGIGAYAVGILNNGEKPLLSFGLALAVGFAVNFLLSLLVAWLSERLRDLYFGLATLALQVIFYSVIYNWTALTEGPYGITAINSPSIFGIMIDNTTDYLILGSIFVLGALFFFRWFETTPLCRMMRSVRDDQLAVISLGKNPFPFKLSSIIIASFWATIAGAIYASYTSYIDPGSFTLDESVLILSILLVGGSGNIIGPIVGAIFYTILPEILRAISLPDSVAANVKMMLFGLILILVVRFKPSGFFGNYQLGK